MHGCFYLKERNFPLNSPNLASPVHPQVNKDPEPDGHLDFCHHACLILTVARLKWFVFRNCICECYVLPLPAFLIASEKKHSAIQGKEHPEFLFYAVASIVFSSGGTQPPRLSVSQQLRSGLVLLHVELNRLMQRDDISQKSWWAGLEQQKLLIQPGKGMQCLFYRRPQCCL